MQSEFLNPGLDFQSCNANGGMTSSCIWDLILAFIGLFLGAARNWVTRSSRSRWTVLRLLWRVQAMVWWSWGNNCLLHFSLNLCEIPSTPLGHYQRSIVCNYPGSSLDLSLYHAVFFLTLIIFPEHKKCAAKKKHSDCTTSLQKFICFPLGWNAGGKETGKAAKQKK